ncbi:hypothetical protein ACFLUJ_08355 [Chloroflexota bacterium]
MRLYQSSTHQLLDIPCNKDFKDVENLLRSLNRKSIIVEHINMDSLSETDILKAYSEAVIPSVFKKFGIRRIFGSRRRSGCLFGREVPALLVYQEGRDHPIDVYPHDEGQGRILTVREFLFELQTKSFLGKS